MQQHNLVLITSPQLGQILQASRKAKKLSQTQLAKRLVLSQSRVSHLEKNPEQLSFAQLIKWCAVLGLELSVGLRKSPADPVATDW